MCIVFYTLSQPGYKLILAANRDEYLDRPSLPAAWHTFGRVPASAPNAETINKARKESPIQEDAEEQDWVLCGRDLGSPMAGTWLGMTRDLRVAVLTNIRQPYCPSPHPSPPSRGLLLKNFLAPRPSPSNPTVHDYLDSYSPVMDDYEGFNLLCFKLHLDEHLPTEIGYLSNRPRPAKTLTDLWPSSRPASPVGGAKGAKVGQCFGLSNSPMTRPWPKVVEGEEAMRMTLDEWADKLETEDELVERMMTLLSPGDAIDTLADTSKTTRLQPLLVGPNADLFPTPEDKKRWYGTTLSTVILVKDSGETVFVERDIGVLDGKGGATPGSKSNERRFAFTAVDSQ
ncbi:hypothetical protein P7C73_g3192, partial [Tremellales sp. Uapishka_1]